MSASATDLLGALELHHGRVLLVEEDLDALHVAVDAEQREQGLGRHAVGIQLVHQQHGAWENTDDEKKKETRQT